MLPLVDYPMCANCRYSALEQSLCMCPDGELLEILPTYCCGAWEPPDVDQDVI